MTGQSSRTLSLLADKMMISNLVFLPRFSISKSNALAVKPHRKIDGKKPILLLLLSFGVLADLAEFDVPGLHG